MRWMILGVAMVALLETRTLTSGELQGAESVLKGVLAAWPNTVVGIPEKTAHRWSYGLSKGTLHLEIEAFAEKSNAMPPADALRGWLALVDKSLQLTPSKYQFGYNYESDLSILLKGLPPPETWADVVREIRSRPIGEGYKAVRMRGLRLLAAAMEADEKTMWAEFDAAAELTAKLGTDGNLFSALEKVHSTLCAQSNDPKLQISTFDWTLSFLEMHPAKEQQLLVPELLAIHSREKAEELILRALRLPGVELNFTSRHSETFKLAQNLAIKIVPDMAAPCWELCRSFDGVQLYEALDKRFPAKEEERWHHFGERDEALMFYIMGLVAKDDMPKAKNAALAVKEISIHASIYEIVEMARNQGIIVKLFNFLHDLLGEHPKAPFWTLYWELAEAGGGREKGCKLIVAGCDDESMVWQANRHLIEILFDSGREAEGLALVRKKIAEAAETEKRMEIALKFAAISRALKNKAYVEEALRKAIAIARLGHPDVDRELPKLAEILIAEGRERDAEELLALTLTRILRDEKNSLEPSNTVQELLICLAQLYSKAGRHGDVLFLLERAPWWDADDLLTIYREYAIGKRSLGAITATALVNTGRKQEADALLRFLLDREPGQDELYRLYLELQGEKALLFFDELQKNHPFEERPLIWKAQLLLNAGKLDDAELAAKQAITIDPSDGEEGHGDRMRVYAVLGEIVKAKGDAKNAVFFRSVIDAIRLSEEADNLRLAGLTQQAIQLYDSALKLFTGAYCIQSRMALQLASIGKLEEAAERYRKAYELMPYSFGRMESHCFGCEGIFRGKFAQDLAEKVFEELLKKDGNKPQLHYLLGQLRESQNRKADAFTAFRKATELDPDYVNAWKHVLQNARTADERIEAATNLVRLNPREQPAFGYGLKLRSVWPLAERYLKSAPPEPKSCFDLPASRTHRDKLRAHMKAEKHSEISITQWFQRHLSRRKMHTTAGSLLAEESTLDAAGGLFGTCMDDLEKGKLGDR